MINSMYGGGAEKIFQTLLNNLEPSKYDITVYSVNQCKIDHKYYPENIKYKYIFEDVFFCVFLELIPVMLLWDSESQIIPE